MVRMILRLDSKRRLSFPATMVSWMPGDYIELTCLEIEVDSGEEEVLVARRIKSQPGAMKAYRKAYPIENDSKASRKKSKKKK